MENPVRQVLHDVAPTLMGASRKLGLGFEATRRVARGLPREIPAAFKMALVQKQNWSADRLAALDREYAAWRDGQSQSEAQAQ